MRLENKQKKIEKYWMPENGIILSLTKEIRMVRNCPYLSVFAKTVQARYLLLNLIVDTHGFYPDEYVEDLEEELGKQIDQDQYYELMQSVEEIHQTVVRRILGIIGNDKNVPIFQKWLSADTAVFYSREGTYSDINPYKSPTHARARRMGRDRRVQEPSSYTHRGTAARGASFSF